MQPKNGSMREAVNSIYQKLIKDEELLRLLYYFPKSNNLRKPNPHPLTRPDEANGLPNIVGSELADEIIEERIVLAEKLSDLVNKEICRLYISMGRRRSTYGNYVMANQEIMISIFVHENYSSDMRQEWISDRLNQLLVLEYMPGIFGKLEYAAGNPRQAPVQYSRYDHIFEFTDNKK